MTVLFTLLITADYLAAITCLVTQDTVKAANSPITRWRSPLLLQNLGRLRFQERYLARTVLYARDISQHAMGGKDSAVGPQLGYHISSLPSFIEKASIPMTVYPSCRVCYL